MLATDIPGVVRRRSSSLSQTRRLSRHSSLSGSAAVSRRASRMSRRTSSNSSHRGSHETNEAATMAAPNSLLEVAVEEEVFSRSGSVRQGPSQGDNARTASTPVQNSNPRPVPTAASEDTLGVLVASPASSGTRAPKSPSNPTSPLMTRLRPSSRRRSASVSTAAARSPRSPGHQRVVDVNALDLAAANAGSSRCSRARQGAAVGSILLLVWTGTEESLVRVLPLTCPHALSTHSSFGAATTSTLPFDQLMAELERVLSKNGHMYKVCYALSVDPIGLHRMMVLLPIAGEKRL